MKTKPRSNFDRLVFAFEFDLMMSVDSGKIAFSFTWMPTWSARLPKGQTGAPLPWQNRWSKSFAMLPCLGEGPSQWARTRTLTSQCLATSCVFLMVAEALKFLLRPWDPHWKMAVTCTKLVLREIVLWTSLWWPITFKSWGLGCLPHYLEVKPVTVCISEDSLKDKRKKVRGALQQVQTMHLITSEALDKVIPDRPRNRYPGTTRGNCVAWVSLTAPSDHWQMTVEEKSVLYGHHCIGSDAAAADDDERKGHEIEPAFFNFLPRTFYEDILSTYSVATCQIYCILFLPFMFSFYFLHVGFYFDWVVQ